MNGQMSVFDFMKPEYNGKQDEILRLHAERELENNIVLHKCCGIEPSMKFISCKEYWVECKLCGKRTKTHKKLYMAMQEWNRLE